MEEEQSCAAMDGIVAQYNTYEDFLDSQISSLDLFYLEDEELARQLVELGYRGSGEVLKREEFETRKAAAEASRLAQRTQQKILSSAGKELKDNFLKALALREEANRNGKMTSIILIRDKNSHGQELSGYIDYSHRLKSEDFEVYFSGKKKLLPRPTDLSSTLEPALCYYLSHTLGVSSTLFLQQVRTGNFSKFFYTASPFYYSYPLSSFYNWETHVSTSNASPNYQVIAENSSGLLFKNKRDRKILNVDPKASPGDNSSRTPIQTDLYIQAVIYDHITRRKT
ncbi:cilia- and flagella-associated protein 299 isoform X1 [Ranitomeya imitator]|uniref:cilia- and flagella-associated protein 299 isoform X1 n=1 Tax=Ranitomeya imitator TaxID=111125 RepID=UPI0037E9536C